MTALVIRRAELEGRSVDLRLEGGLIAAIGPSLAPETGDRELDAHGGAVIPGLHDHHLHLAALAAARSSVDVTTTGDLRRALDAAGPGPGDGWIRVVGYHEANHGPLDRWILDALAPGRRVRVQHQTGRRWILSSAALHAVGGSERFPDGWLDGADDWLRERVPPVPLDFGSVGRELLAFGVTGCTDATPSEDLGAFDLLARAGFAQRVMVTGGPGLAAVVPPAPLVAGPVKVVLADHDLPSLDAVVDAFTAARAAGRTVAVHAVTLAAALLVLAAWDDVGARDGDRLEHGSVLPPELAQRLAAHGVRVVTQPGFVHSRGDRYLASVDLADRPFLYPCASLLDAGVRVAGSTDAPYGDPDPWRAIAAAADRTTAAGRSLGPGERVSPRRALELFLGPLDDPGGPPRTIRAGAPAELCVLRAPLADILDAPSAEHVVAVAIGELLHEVR
jgi:predicted amidohydrolase YtcJ